MTREDRIMAALSRGIDRHNVVDQVRDYLVDQEARGAMGRPVDCQEVQIAKATEMLAPAVIAFATMINGQVTAEYDWVFRDDGRDAVGTWRDGNSFGPSIGSR